MLSIDTNLLLNCDSEASPHHAAPGTARYRLYDIRTALALRAFWVTEFATANVQDFEGFCFAKVWNPIRE